MSAALRVGTRGSALARSQTSTVTAAVVGELGRKVETVEIVTHGDRSTAALTQISGTGISVSALRDMTVGQFLADAVMILGSMDIVLCDVDR